MNTNNKSSSKVSDRNEYIDTMIKKSEYAELISGYTFKVNVANVFVTILSLGFLVFPLVFKTDGAEDISKIFNISSALSVTVSAITISINYLIDNYIDAISTKSQIENPRYGLKAQVFTGIGLIIILTATFAFGFINFSAFVIGKNLLTLKLTLWFAIFVILVIAFLVFDFINVSKMSKILPSPDHKM